MYIGTDASTVYQVFQGILFQRGRGERECVFFSRGGVKVFALGGVFQTREEDTIRGGISGFLPGEKMSL